MNDDTEAFHSKKHFDETDDDHVRLASSSTAPSQNADPIILRLWRQGFTINDSELRLYDDQKNKEFLEYITQGWVIINK